MSRLGQPPGAILSIEGRKTHIQCSGAGSPAVILEAGIGSNSLQWSLVQKEVAAFARVCSYDRAGTGWSERRPGVRDAARISGELEALLAVAGERPPYLLVGHSLGGILARVFASRRPQDIAGLVLIDPSPTELKQGWASQLAALLLIESMPLLQRVGIEPLRDQMAPFAQDLPADVLSDLMATYEDPTQIRTFRDEFRAIAASSKQASEGLLPSSLPVVVLSAEQPMSKGQAELVRQVQTEHARLAARFVGGRHRVIGGSNHLTLVTNRTFVSEIVAEIRLMLHR